IDKHVVRPVGGNWAAEGLAASALLNGQGASSLSSYNDPVDSKAWRVLDPDGRFEPAWNRLGYIDFLWDPTAREPIIENPEADVVRVRVDPCDARLARLRLVAILAEHAVDAPCLRKLDTLHWHGEHLSAYRVVKS